MASRGEALAETAMGAVVLAAAAGFLIYALGNAGAMGGGGGYTVVARFGQVGALAPGADVRIAGVKVGSVTKVELEPKTYLARTALSINSDVKLPADSTVKITSDGLLGGQHLAIAPGSSTEDMKPGGEFENVQGAVDLFGLIGQVIRPPAPAEGAAAAPAAAAPKAADPYPGGD
jgi:phospholipid/cholesterol/gamma-HCH transport system substrate-binding protein